MAHAYSQGSATNTADFFTKLNTFVVTTCGWTLLDNQSGLGTDPYYIWSSVGESGEEKIFIRCTNGTAQADYLSLHTYRYWNEGTQTGVDPAPAFAYTTNSFPVDDDLVFTYFLYGDLDAVQIVVKIGNTYYFASFGLLTSTYSRTMATTSNAETAGSNVVIEVDATTAFTAGQYYGIINSNSGATGQSYERILVSAIDPGVSITATLANNHAAGAVVGVDPRPNYVATKAIGTCSMLGTSGAALTYTGFATATIIGSSDPDARQGLYWLYPIWLYQGTEATQEVRGTLKNVYVSGVGLAATPLASEDTITVGATIYKYFITSSWGSLAIKQE
jgi:hypothetical protein